MIGRSVCVMTLGKRGGDVAVATQSRSSARAERVDHLPLELALVELGALEATENERSWSGTKLRMAAVVIEESRPPLR